MAACISWTSAADRAARVLDWNTMGIDWQGRGWDRGLRGIEFDGETVYIAASDELFAYTPDFRPIGSWRNRYLKHCHEICRHERTLFLTSTGFDSILGFDLDTKSFSWGLQVAAVGDGFAGRPFDPEFETGPAPGNRLHLNNVFCAPGGMHISGMRTGGVLLFNGREIRRWVTIPVGAHNARPFRDGVLFNDTEADVVRFAIPERRRRAFSRCRAIARRQLTHVDPDDTRLARQAFGRGLCVIDDDRIAAGSSPSTITLHDLRPGHPARMATLSHDVRNAIHGLEVWPFGWMGGRLPVMDIGVPIRNFGKVEAEPLAAAILAQDEAAWNENVQRQRDYEVHEQTRSIVLLFAEVKDWPSVEVSKEPGWDRLSATAVPVMHAIIRQWYPPGGTIIRAMAAKLLAGGRILPHRDSHPSFGAGHRIHVPDRHESAGALHDRRSAVSARGRPGLRDQQPENPQRHEQGRHRPHQFHLRLPAAVGQTGPGGRWYTSGKHRRGVTPTAAADQSGGAPGDSYRLYRSRIGSMTASSSSRWCA